MNIALDIDGTISKMPDMFSMLSKSTQLEGGKVIIITSRAKTPEVEVATRAELKDYGVSYDDLYIISDDKEQQIPCPHEELDWYDSYLWQKVKICQDYSVKIDAIFEDDLKVMQLFRKYAPEIQIFQVH